MTGADDLRSREDGLGWVTRAVFGDQRITLVVDAPVPAGHTVVARYAVVPSVDRARFLLPLGSSRATAAALLAYNALRPVKVRAVRAALGVAARAGVVARAPFPVLSVAVPAALDPAEVLLAERLSTELGGGRAYAACGVRPPDPNHKPTLQLFDHAGTPRGYAKIGWNDATRALVTAEAAALREVAEVAGVAGHPATPRLLAETNWAGQAVALVEPLPTGVRGVPVDAPPELAALLAVARRGRPPATPRPLAGSSFLDRLTVAAQRAAETDPAGARAVAAVAELARRHGDVAVEFGHWHGDWVPWNLGRHAGELVAWDWEHSGPDVPVGFDLAHDAFQRSLVLRGEPAATAAEQVTQWLDRYGDRLGLDPARRRLVADAYLIEMWLRTWRLADAGAGWNPALHPALLDVIEKRQ
ncbi:MULTISPECIES: hypothetical protein [Micromonospora]|uniref:Aminoglycoside phosphotransferase domain-containing protein n=1 Tax=Micromonospora maris TaxID=1003110 RepID=A0A9X0I9E3_9ACTN|nr:MULTISPECIES: hypothetical protein [Micromonospora]AEB44094.1 hypothetical protein VAB18032_14910 [Micromonospora maris AB-18-032]KUJ49312.1 hypothetical protein ADL17_10295 [Micromonospora maris]RUL91244.1 hypothetical protein EG812_20970 [Verrucosispora sp. FIM060022]